MKLHRGGKILLAAAAVVGLVTSVLAVSASASINDAAKDTLASSNGIAIRQNWSNSYTYFSQDQTRVATTKGHSTARWTAYELLSHGDKKYNYFAIQVDISQQLDRLDYPYRASPAAVIVGWHGGNVKVVDQAWTKPTTLGEKCTSWLSVGLNGGLGPLSASTATANFKTCGGGTKLTVGKPLPTWHFSNWNNVKSAQLYYLVKVNAAWKPDFQITMVTPDDTVSNGRVTDRNRYQSVKTNTYCKVGTRGCPAV